MLTWATLLSILPTTSSESGRKTPGICHPVSMVDSLRCRKVPVLVLYSLGTFSPVLGSSTVDTCSLGFDCETQPSSDCWGALPSRCGSGGHTRRRRGSPSGGTRAVSTEDTQLLHATVRLPLRTRRCLRSATDTACRASLTAPLSLSSEADVAAMASKAESRMTRRRDIPLRWTHGRTWTTRGTTRWSALPTADADATSHVMERIAEMAIDVPIRERTDAFHPTVILKLRLTRSPNVVPPSRGCGVRR